MATKKSRQTRGRKSSIDCLPEDIKHALDDLLLDNSITQQDILAEVNLLLDEAGIPRKISKSSLNRYATKIETVGSRIRDMREMADVWTKNLGDKPSGEISKFLIETLRTMALETTLDAAEGGEPMSPGLIKELALGIQRLEKAADLGIKREKEIRKAFAEETAAAIDEAVEQSGNDGLSADTISIIKKQILAI